MSLSVFRAKGYAFGVLAGAFGALTVVATRQKRYVAALLSLLGALVCGALSVANEEAATELDTAGE